MLYVLCFALLMLGFWLISLGFTSANGWVFGAGILCCTLTFFIPVVIGDRDRG